MSFSNSEPPPARHKAPLKGNKAFPDRRLVPPSKKWLETKGSLGLGLELLSARTKQSCLTVQAISSTFSVGRESDDWGQLWEGRLRQPAGRSASKKAYPRPGQTTRAPGPCLPQVAAWLGNTANLKLPGQW